MKQIKYHYYVLVLTKAGPVFVTSEGENNMCYWNKLQEPKEFSKEYARDMVIGLTCNGYVSYVIESKWEIEGQPYMYQYGELQWVKFEKKEE